MLQKHVTRSVADWQARQRIHELEQRVRQLESYLAGQGQGDWRQDWALVAPNTSLTELQPPAPGPAPPPVPPPANGPPVSMAARVSVTERLLGGNWLARIGVLVLALGVLFLLKLAWDNNWVSLAGRIAIGVVGGLAIFATGEVLRLRRFDPTYSQILAGGGALITYGTLYAAYALPNYRAALGLTLALDIVLLAVMAALFAGYAFWRNLPVLAGVAVGLCALLVAPAGEFSSAGVVFMGALGALMLAVAALRRWDSIVLTSVLTLDLAHVAAAGAAPHYDVPWWLVAGMATVVNLLAVAAASRSTGDAWASRVVAGGASALLCIILAIGFADGGLDDPFAWSLLLVGAASLAACADRRLAPALGAVGAIELLAWPYQHFDRLLEPAVLGALAASALGASLLLPAGRWIRAGAALGAALGAASLFGQELTHSLVAAQPWLAGLLALGLFLLNFALWLLDRKEVWPSTYLGGLTALLLLAVWPLLQFPESLWQSFTYAAVATCLLAASFALPARQPLQLGALAAGWLGVLSLLLLDEMAFVGDEQPLGVAGVAAMVLGIGIAAWLTARDAVVRWAAVTLAAASPIVATGIALDSWAVPVSWGIVAIAAAAVGLGLRRREVRTVSLGLFGLLVLRIFLVDLAGLSLPARVVAFLATGALLLLGAYLFARQDRSATLEA